MNARDAQEREVRLSSRRVACGRLDCHKHHYKVEEARECPKTGRESAAVPSDARVFYTAIELGCIYTVTGRLTAGTKYMAIGYRDRTHCYYVHDDQGILTGCSALFFK